MIVSKEIIINKPQKSLIKKQKKENFCEIFTYEPCNMEEMCFGNLYIIAHLKRVSEKSCHLINLLASLMKREYYDKTNQAASESIEKCLKKANRILEELAKAGNIEWIGNLNYICVAICQNNLYMAKTGNVQAFFWRNGHLENLIKKINQYKEQQHPSKVFRNIISGKIEQGDKLILSSDNFLKTNDKELKQILNLGDINVIYDKLTEFLKDELSLAILLIELQKDEILIKKPQTQNIENQYITPPIDINEIIG